MSAILSFAPLAIAFLPLLLELLERLLDKCNILGFKYVVRLMGSDSNPGFKTIFLTDEKASLQLEAARSYFEFEDAATDVLKSHIAFALSLIFSLLGRNRPFPSLESWPIAVLALVVMSLVWFLIQLVTRPNPAVEDALKIWKRWVWALFVVILIGEGAELFTHPGP